MENENLTDQELLRLRSVEFWRGRVQELVIEVRDLREENKLLREQRDYFAFEAITGYINNNTDWSDK